MGLTNTQITTGLCMAIVALFALVSYVFRKLFDANQKEKAVLAEATQKEKEKIIQAYLDNVEASTKAQLESTKSISAQAESVSAQTESVKALTEAMKAHDIRMREEHETFCDVLKKINRRKKKPKGDI